MVPAYLKLDGILGWMRVVPEGDSTGEEGDELPPNPLEVLEDRFLFFAFLFMNSDVVVVVVSATLLF